MSRPAPLSFTGWLQAHAAVARDSLARLRQAGLSSLLTVLMMGCTLALPAVLWVLADNAAGATDDWRASFSVSLYLAERIEDGEGRNLAQALAAEPAWQSAEFISRGEALAEFREHSGFGRALELLDANPLPAVIVLSPAPELGAQNLEPALAALRERRDVDLVQADSDWLARLEALLDFGRQLIRIMAGLLALTVVLVVGNTIRLDIQNRREEIVVMKLIGAPDGFIQRPFLYTGALYGGLSGLVAGLSVIAILALLQPRLDALAALYGASVTLQGLALGDMLRLAAAALVLGWLGAWLSVRRHLQAIEPE